MLVSLGHATATCSRAETPSRPPRSRNVAGATPVLFLKASPFSVRVLDKRKKLVMATGNEDWRRNADTHKMSPEEVKAAGVEGSKRPPGRNPGEVLHQRGKLPFSLTTMAVTGFLITATIGYLVLYAKKKPEATAGDVAKVATGAADPRDTHPRK